MTTIRTVLIRLRAEYLEMPGLRLTLAQVQRLCGIEQVMCQSALDSLLNGSGIEVVGQFGTVLRSDDRLVHVAVKVEATRRGLFVRHHEVGVYSFVRSSS